MCDTFSFPIASLGPFGHYRNTGSIYSRHFLYIGLERSLGAVSHLEVIRHEYTVPRRQCSA